MENLLEDSTKFTRVETDILKAIFKYEDRNNRLCLKLHKENLIDEDTKDAIRATGSRPGVMYGLPKVHKPGVPLRPILSTKGTYNYSMSQFLVKMLTPVVDNEFTVSDSFQFCRKISSFTPDKDTVMVSFDIQSLFTNIPIEETCKIIIDKLFPLPDSSFNGFCKQDFKKMLDNCCKDNIFIFNKQTYIQKDGAPMGGCISPTLANLFLGFHEKIWLNNCPAEFKPNFYTRNMDDTFTLFQNTDHAHKFLSYLIKQDPSIKFTIELQKNNTLSFLDVSVKKK